MIPYCWYGSYENITTSGIKLGPYGQRYCHLFQEIINENGICYTYNSQYLNANGMGLPEWRTKYFERRKIAGTGPMQGLRLVVDLAHTAHKSHQVAKGFIVYIGDPGSATPNTQFVLNPASGEYSFRIYSSNALVASQEYIEWNKKEKVLVSTNGVAIEFKISYSSNATSPRTNP